MTLSKKKIDRLWEKAKNGKYYYDKDIKKNNGSIKGLKKYNFKGEIIKD